MIKSQRQTRNEKILSSFGEHTTQGVTKFKNKRCAICNPRRKILQLQIPHTTFIVNKNLSCNSINVVYVIECCNSKKKRRIHRVDAKSK